MRTIPLIFLLFIGKVAWSQEKESFYVFNASWKPTKIDSAHFLLHVHRVNDSCWQWDYYNFTGPLLKSEQYLDKEGNQLNGLTRLYNDKGMLDSAVTYKLGRLDGDAYKLGGDSFHIQMKYRYRNDSLLSIVDPAAQKPDTAKYADEKESEYPGGAGQWLRYLNKHLQYPDRAVNGKVEGEVRVLFIVDKDGGIQDPYIGKSVEYSLDEKSLRIVRGS
ncbi:MAG: TonB family protein, partial [Bacteroidetes bacterium]|nr:TonB family protein [Bacteroidota bacterium]